VLRDFDDRVNHYVRLHRRLERSLPPEHLFDNSEDMPVAGDPLRDALIDARPYAQPGTFFTPSVGYVISTRLERAIAGLGIEPGDVWIAMNRGFLPDVPDIRVNGRFSTIRYMRIWPALLSALPALPKELEYRIVDRDLVLVDVHADLVIDILEDALPPPFTGMSRDFAPPRNSSRGGDPADV
jgi:hypothetical protein